MFRTKWEDKPEIVELREGETGLAKKVSIIIGTEKVVIKEAHGGKSRFPYGAWGRKPLAIQVALEFLLNVAAYDASPTALEVRKGKTFLQRKVFILGARRSETTSGWIRVVPAR